MREAILSAMFAASVRRFAALVVSVLLLAILCVVVSGPASARRSGPIRVVTTNGYKVKVWDQVRHESCWRHSYGQVRDYTSTHECGRSLTRILATTRLPNGRGVSFAVYECAFNGTERQIYKRAGYFRWLVSQNGTGMFYTMFRDGYRLPAGPQHVPTNAFRAMAQDAGVWIFQAWYTHGSTPANARPLERMENNLFLAF